MEHEHEDDTNTLPPLPHDTQHPHPHIPPPQPILQPNPAAGRSDTSHVSVVVNPVTPRPTSSFAADKSPFEDADALSARGSTPPDHARREGGSVHTPRELGPPRRSRTVDTHLSARRSGLDWIVPVEEKKEPVSEQSLPPAGQASVSDRLQPTIDVAVLERAKYDLKAKYSGYALNAAIGLQVALGALTTGLSAVTSGRQTSITVSVLGGLTTIIASYLARARGSNEPELSITRCKDIDQFLREARAFQLDRGHILTSEYDADIQGYRKRFEELLGNANGERRLSPV